MKRPLAIVLLLAALAAPVVLFLLLVSQAHLNGWIAAAAAVAAGWALNVAWAMAVDAESRGSTLAVATHFGWACPSVLVLLAWLVSPVGPFR